MKKLIVILLIGAVVSWWYNARPQASEVSLEIAAQHDEDVILYATEWCGYCAKTRKFLAEKNIPYIEYDIEKSAKGAEQYSSLGGNGVPLLVVKGEIVRGYGPQQIVALLNR